MFTISVRDAMSALRLWQARQWAVACAGAVLTAVVVGVPTDVVPNPWFGRAVPVQWWNPPVLAVTSVLAGLVLATYVRRDSAPAGSRLGSAGGVLSFLAVGCPVCNKVVLLLLGTSGAMTFWAPVQPLLAVASVVLLAVALLRRLSAEAACPVPSAAGTAAVAGTPADRA